MVQANAAMLAVLIPQCLAQAPGTAAHLALAQTVLQHGGPDLRPAATAAPTARVASDE